jgi:hypothetical protein
MHSHCQVFLKLLHRFLCSPLLWKIELMWFFYSRQSVEKQIQKLLVDFYKILGLGVATPKCTTWLQYFFTMTKKFVGMCVAKPQAFFWWWFEWFFNLPLKYLFFNFDMCHLNHKIQIWDICNIQSCAPQLWWVLLTIFTTPGSYQLGIELD